MDFSEILKRAKAIKKSYAELSRREGNKVWGASEHAQGLVGDVGDLMKLIMAKDGYWYTAEKNIREELKKELSDCLWSILMIADECNVDLEKEILNTLERLEGKIAEREVLKKKKKRKPLLLFNK